MPTAELIRVRLDLTPEQHSRLRVEAAKADMPMSQFTRQIVLNYLDGRYSYHEMMVKGLREK